MRRANRAQLRLVCVRLQRRVAGRLRGPGCGRELSGIQKLRMGNKDEARREAPYRG